MNIWTASAGGSDNATAPSHFCPDENYLSQVEQNRKQATWVAYVVDFYWRVVGVFQFQHRTAKEPETDNRFARVMLSKVLG